MVAKNVGWIIERDILDYTDRLVDYLSSHNIPYSYFTYQDLVTNKLDKNDITWIVDEFPIVFVGSLRAVQAYNSRCYSVSPGAICTLKNFDCTNYYPSWNKYLLNSDWSLTMKPLIEREIGYLEGCYISENQEFFFRPNEGDKRFTGVISTRIQILEQIKDTEIVIRADKKIIGDEYRFLIVDKKVISGVQYPFNLDGNNRLAAQKYLEKILEDKNLFMPDRAFTVDIGENLDTRKFGVIELNSFSCANLYYMSMDKVVPVINELAEIMYKEYWGED
jgi:hypothetical protein